MSNQVEDFDWDKFEAQGFGGGYSKSERAEMEQMYGDTLTTVQEEEVIKGTVVGITDRDVILNIGFKSDGLVPISEFRDASDWSPGAPLLYAAAFYATGGAREGTARIVELKIGRASCRERV